jgi:hypothetical protein
MPAEPHASWLGVEEEHLFLEGASVSMPGMLSQV